MRHHHRVSEPRQSWFSPERDTAINAQVENPFDSASVASRYVAGRPYYHRTALALAVERLGLDRVDVALDVGCGTGLSTRAVSELADRVIAIDTSTAMLWATKPVASIGFFAAEAERLPLRDGCVDLATVGAAFHWFDQAVALAELARVLRVDGALVVYSDFFHGRLEGRPDFTDWLTGSYLPRYPSPVRHAYFDPDAARSAGFAAPTYAESELVVPLTTSQLADYMISQSNAATAIESGRVEVESLREQIIDETSPFFPHDQAAGAIFGVRVWTTTNQDRRTRGAR